MKYIFLLLTMGVLLAGDAQSQVNNPSKSFLQIVKQYFFTSYVEVSYSRPARAGRRVFGDLVPYGKVWITGTNAVTKITFGSTITFAGQKVPAGTYGILIIPNDPMWTVILTKQLDITSPAAYKQDRDVLRVSMLPDMDIIPINNFSVSFNNVSDKSMVLMLQWDRECLNIPITAGPSTL